MNLAHAITPLRNRPRLTDNFTRSLSEQLAHNYGTTIVILIGPFVLNCELNSELGEDEALFTRQTTISS